MKVQHPFKTLKYPFLINIVVDGKRTVSLNSDNLEMKVYQKGDGEMVEFLKITGKSDTDNNKLAVTLSRKARNLLYIST